jgi:predicted transcriptional regulator
MRIFEVRIRTLAEDDADFVKSWKLAEAGLPGPGDRGVFFSSFESACALFTEKRLEMLRLIRKHKPTSINQLAKLAKRDFKNVYTDVIHFRNLDIVDVPRGKRVGEPLKVLYDAFDLRAII